MKLYNPKANDAPTGEPDTEFEKADGKGPFECGNCIHMKSGYCYHPVMMKRSRQPKNEQGAAKVGSHDCCKFVRR